MHLQQRLRFALTLTFRSLSQSSRLQSSVKVETSEEKSPTKNPKDKSAKKVSKENNSDKISKEKNPAAKIPKNISARKDTIQNNSVNISASEESLKEKVSENISNEKSSEKDRAIAFINTLPRCPLCGGFLGNSSLETHLRHNHSKMINLKLREEPHKTYSKIFGDKNIKTMSTEQIRWPEGLVVTNSGDRQGQWYDFKQNVGGNPIDAIAYARKVDYIDALKIAANEFDFSEGLTRNSHDFKSSDANDVDNVSKKVSSTKIDFQEQNEKNKETRLKKAKTAEFLWKQSKPITQSQLGKKYLTEHRKIPGYVLAYLEFRLLRKGTKYAKWNATTQEYEKKTMEGPAIVVPVENAKSEIVAVQRIYLNPNTGKKAADKAKFTLGDLKGHAAIIHRGKIGADKLVIAEGPETAASIADAIDAVKNEIPILASLSLGNLENLKDLIADHWKPKRVIIAADNDNDENLPQAISELENFLRKRGIEVAISIPQLETGTKCDWNDVLKAHGTDHLRNIFSKI